MKLTNLENFFRKTLAERTDLNKQEKLQLYKQKKEQHRQEIYKEIEDYFFFERDDNGVFIINGEDEITCNCPKTIEINNAQFFLYKDFTFRAGNLYLSIFFKGELLFEIDICDVTQFSIYN